MTECYVCYDPCTTPAPCLCKTLHVHPSCILIMRIYGKTECGICKTPYLGPPVELVEELPQEEEVVETQPWCCFIIPTQFRDSTSETDNFVDIVRYVVLFVIILIIFHVIINPNTINIDNDWVPSFMLFMGVMCCCSAVGQTIKQKRRNLHLHRHRAAVIA